MQTDTLILYMQELRHGRRRAFKYHSKKYISIIAQTDFTMIRHGLCREMLGLPATATRPCLLTSTQISLWTLSLAVMSAVEVLGKYTLTTESMDGSRKGHGLFRFYFYAATATTEPDLWTSMMMGSWILCKLFYQKTAALFRSRGY